MIQFLVFCFNYLLFILIQKRGLFLCDLQNFPSLLLYVVHEILPAHPHSNKVFGSFSFNLGHLHLDHVFYDVLMFIDLVEQHYTHSFIAFIYTNYLLHESYEQLVIFEYVPKSEIRVRFEVQIGSRFIIL